MPAVYAPGGSWRERTGRPLDGLQQARMRHSYFYGTTLMIIWLNQLQMGIQAITSPMKAKGSLCCLSTEATVSRLLHWLGPLGGRGANSIQFIPICLTPFD